jgi:hypothetical protein
MSKILVAAIARTRAEIVEHWGEHDQTQDLLLQTALVSGDISRMASKTPSICLNNLLAAMRFRESLLSVGVPPDICLFVHGSTGRGTGQVAPNIDFRLQKDGRDITMDVRVLPDCRDDVDMVLVIDDPAPWEGMVCEVTRTIAQGGIPITVNLVSRASLTRELQDPDSPAVRRILLFNRPKWLLGEPLFRDFTTTAKARQSWLDWPHEVDFKTLMRVADIMSRLGMETHAFSSECLFMLFPSLYVACRDSLHIGFPRERRKIHYD